MQLKKLRTNENGYLLLESLVTLSLIVTILLILYPLIVDWMVLREMEKEKVEHTRVLYETSMQWPTSIQYIQNDYSVHSTNTTLTITKNKQTYGGTIYEVEFNE